MEITTPSSLEGIKQTLQQLLEKEIGDQFAYEVSFWWNNETSLLVLIHLSIDNWKRHPKSLQTLLEKLRRDSAQLPYHVQWRVEENFASQRLLLPSSSLVPSISLLPSRLTLYKRLKKRKYRRIQFQLIGMGLGMVSGLGLLYGITRPCVIDHCPQIQQAKAKEISAFSDINSDLTETEINIIKAQIQQSIVLLSPIPPWSAYYHQARTLMYTYLEQVNQLQSLQTAFEQGNQSQPNPLESPLSLTELEQQKKKLEEAIARLDTISIESDLNTAIQAKREQYQRTLVTIEQRLQAEKMARQQLEKGINLGKLALEHQKIAKSLKDWYLVSATWQNALQNLKSINNRTTSYQTAQSHLQQFSLQHIQVQNKIKKEEKRINLEYKAKEQVKHAEYWQKKQDWKQSIQYWQKAIATLEQIPSHSVQSTEAQTLLKTYKTAFNQANYQQQLGAETQEIEQYLKRICQGSQSICTYTVQQNLIIVSLTSEYTQKVWDTALQSKLQGNQQTQISLLNHLSALEKQLKTLSLSTQKRVDLYHSNRQLMMTFQTP